MVGKDLVDCPTRWSLWYLCLDFYVDHLYFDTQMTEKYSTAMCWQGPSELVLVHLYTIWGRFVCCLPIPIIGDTTSWIYGMNIRQAWLLFRFASGSVFDKLNQSTNSETAMLSNEHSSPIHASWIHVSYINEGLNIWTWRYWSHGLTSRRSRGPSSESPPRRCRTPAGPLGFNVIIL